MKLLNNRDKNIAEKSPSFLAIDIGTEAVKTALYILDGEEIHIIGYSRIKQQPSSMYAAFILDLESVVDVIDKGIGEAVAMAKDFLDPKYSLPKKVIFGIAGELVQGMAVVVNIERENPEKPISEREIVETLRKVKEDTFESAKEEIAEEIGIKVQQVMEIDTYINSVYIDGVRVTNALGYKGTEIVYKVFSTFAPKIHIESLEQIVAKLNLSIDKVVVEPYALSVGLKDTRSNNSNAIIIDIGGGTTDIAVVENGDIIGTKMFAIGGRVFTKRVQKELNLDYETAESKKLEYSNGDLNRGEANILKKHFEADVKIWLTGIEVALEEFEDVSEYPSNIYLCGGGALLPDIQEGLISHPWLQRFNFKKFPKVDFVFPNSVTKVSDKTQKAILPIDVTPLSLARMKLE